MEHPSLPIKFAICNAPFSNTRPSNGVPIKTWWPRKRTRRWLLIVQDFAGPFWQNCMDLPEFFTEWWVVCSNVSRWARKHCTNSLNTKNVKTRISEIPSWILLDNNMRSWQLDCYKTKLCKEKKVWNLPLKKNTTQSWNHWVQTKTEHQRRPLGKSPKFRENQWKSVFWDNLCALFVSTLGAPSVLPNCLYWVSM